MHRQWREKMKITGEIFQVGGGDLTSFEDAAIYLIHFGEHAALVDAGCGRGTERLLGNIRRCGTQFHQIQYLLITHCHFDHTGGVKAILDRIQCQVVAHELDARFLEKADDEVTAAKWYGSSLAPFEVHRKLSQPVETIALGDRTIQAIHIPGHSPGSVAFLTESENLKVLFAQDVHGPLDPSLLSDKEHYHHSLNLLLSLDADILCEGHYGVYKGKKKVRGFIKSFL